MASRKKLDKLELKLTDSSWKKVDYLHPRALESKTAVLVGKIYNKSEVSAICLGKSDLGNR